MKIEMEAIGFLRGGRGETLDDNWGKVRASIHLDESRFTANALMGLEEFSHIEVLFHFYKASPDKIETAARHPRGNSSFPRLGIFAQRAKGRTNRIGSTICRLIAIEGTRLEVEGLDAIDGTPILDIKPYMSSFGPKGETREPVWVSELMEKYWE